MSEYIEIETELSDDETTMQLYTNLPLAEEGVETYTSLEEMEEGSPVAQALSVVEGIETLLIDGRNLTLTRSPTGTPSPPTSPPPLKSSFFSIAFQKNQLVLTEYPS